MLELVAVIGFYWGMIFLMFRGYIWFGKLFGFIEEGEE